ncbi:hypothetical protein EXE43_28670, partial [Halorubrum sp. SS5]
PNIRLDDGSGAGGDNGGGSNGNGNGNGGNGGGQDRTGVDIHTSCSVPLRIGDVYGGLYEIVAAATTDGEPLCGS